MHCVALTIGDLSLSVLVDAITIDDETLEEDPITCHWANWYIFIQYPREMVATKGNTIFTHYE